MVSPYYITMSSKSPLSPVCACYLRLFCSQRVIIPTTLFFPNSDTNVSWAKFASYCISQLTHSGPSSPVHLIGFADNLSHFSFSPYRRGCSITTVPLLDFAQRHVTKGLNHLTEDVIVEGEGSWVTMHSRQKLLDFTCGIGVTNLGASE
ncbi:hypothetical protein EI94DRAFT_1239608 [Lactarius quietus]|nr:hypothetical protein EI94DRAFT_1239608 [Lactarius quietus]